jgi:phosphatidate phosphatase PAH1
MKICSTALDVVAVSDIHGNIYSTKFHVQFQETILDYTALSLLGIHTRRNHPNQSKTFTSEQQDKITNSNSSNNLHSNTDNDDSVNDISKQAKLDRQFLLQQNQIEPEWCSIFCNNQKCPEILAFIGVDDLLVFIDKNEINEYEECEQLKANEIFIPTEINDTTSPLRQQQYQRKAYDFTYTPSSKILEYLHLNKGCNKIICKNRLSGVIAEFNVFLYEYTDKLVIMDIDGTVTKSDVRGYFESVYLGNYVYLVYMCIYVNTFVYISIYMYIYVIMDIYIIIQYVLIITKNNLHPILRIITDTLFIIIKDKGITSSF